MLDVPSSGRWRRAASLLLGLALVSLSLADAVWGQAAREQVTVRTKHANVHMGPTTATQVLVLVPKGTVLPVIKRQGPWVLVELSPKLRETGTPMRWYKGEKQGWLHESYLEPQQK